jgi:hypothetical protein
MVDTTKRANIGLLQHVFCVAVIPNDAARDTVEPAILLPDNQPDGGGVPLTRALDELELVDCRLLKSMFDHGDHELRPAILDAKIGERFPA